MHCPECRSDVTPEVGFCFTCMKHVSSEPTQLIVEPAPAPKRRFKRSASNDLVIEESLAARYAAETQTANVRQWEPGSLGTSQVFGVVAGRSQWRRSAPTAG